MKRIFPLVFILAACAACSKQDPDRVVVTALRIEPETEQLSLTVGETRTLSYTLTPANASDKRIFWESMDPEVVAVDDKGRLNALKAGSTYVVLTALADSRIIDRVRIDVSDPVVGVERVVIGSEDFEMVTGDDVTLTYSVLPEDATNREVVWESLEPAVAVVDDDGRVDALSAGNARIVLISLADTRITDTVAIVVKDPVVDVTAVDILDADCQLLVGRSKTFACEVHPENATFRELVWTSSDPQVASVDENGLVTALSDGQAVITAASQRYGHCTDAVTVTVQTGVSSIAVAIPNPVVYAGFQRQATCTVSPQNASWNVTWSSSDPAVATVDGNGVVTARAGGTAVIVSTATDGTNMQGSAVVTVLNSLSGTYRGTLSGKERSISVTVWGVDIHIWGGDAVNKTNHSMTVNQISETQCVVAVNFGNHTCDVTCNIAYNGTNATAISGTGGIHRGYFGKYELDCRGSVRSGSYITNDGTVHLDLMREASGEVLGKRLGWEDAYDYLYFDGSR